jgi:hypothetical protein
MILSKKKYYYPITIIKKLDVINNLKEQIKISEDGFKKTSIDFLNSIRDLKPDLFFNSSNHNQQTIQDFIDDNHINDIELLVNNSTTFLSNIKNYINSQKLLEKSQNYQGAYLDIVDASYNFRGLKLKNLNILNNEGESDY